MNSVTNRLIKGSAWISASRAIVNILAALSTIVLARILSPSDFGLVALGTTMLALVTSVTDLSLTEALVRHKSPGDSHFNAAWTMNAARGLLICLLFVALAYPTARFYEEDRLPAIMIALGLSVFLSGLTNPRRIMLQRQLVFWQEFVLNVSQKLAGVIVSVIVAIVYHSYWALVAGVIVTQLTNVAVSYMAMPFRPRITFKHCRELLSFSIWLTAGQVINTLNWRFDQLLLGKYLGNAALGYYTVGSNLALLPTREMTAQLTQTVFPGFAQVANDKARLAAAYQRAQAFVTAVALPAGIGCALIADPLVRLAMGDKWAPAIFIIQALGAVYALQTLGSLVQPLGMAQGQTRIFFIRNAQLLFLRIPFIIAGMYLGGLKGVVIARILTGVMSIFVNMRLVTRFTGLKVLDQVFINVRSLVSVSVMAAGTVVIMEHVHFGQDHVGLIKQIVFEGAIGMFFYCATTAVLWHLMKRPKGPETEIFALIGKILGKRAVMRGALS